MGFRSWQPPVGRLILAKRASGKYAATIGGTGLSIPRQVGKTFLVGAIVFALCLLLPNLTVIWTAHRLRTAEETFGKMQAFAKRKKIAPHIAKIVLGSGDEAITFRNGSRILFGARERGFGRGFDEVDVLIFDEAQILTDNALDDMIPATNQSRKPAGALLLFMGTPPKPTDPGDVFRRMRTEALSGEDEDTGWVEFGADPGYKPPPVPAPLAAEDWRQVAKANPSFPHDTPREAILRMRKKLGADSYAREGLGIWDEVDPEGDAFANFSSLADPKAERGENPSWGVAVAPDGSWSAVAVAWQGPDGVPFVTVTRNEQGAADYRGGTGWLPDRVKTLRERWHGDVYGNREARALVPDAKKVGTAEAQMAFAAAVESGQVRHGNTPELLLAVQGCRWKRSGETRVLEGKSGIDITPLTAAALALHGLSANSVHEPFLIVT